MEKKKITVVMKENFAYFGSRLIYKWLIIVQIC